jgi:hypothetical protein
VLPLTTRLQVRLAITADLRVTLNDVAKKRSEHKFTCRLKAKLLKFITDIDDETLTAQLNYSNACWYVTFICKSNDFAKFSDVLTAVGER